MREKIRMVVVETLGGLPWDRLTRLVDALCADAGLRRNVIRRIAELAEQHWKRLGPKDVQLFMDMVRVCNIFTPEAGMRFCFLAENELGADFLERKKLSKWPKVL